ncbi:MAG: MFS transporter [Planctomycetes bacterium]|nr:MFS transporter [Planctomycetota bacterium]
MSTATEMLDESEHSTDAEGVVLDGLIDVAVVAKAPVNIEANVGATADARPKFFYGWLMLPLAMLLMVASSPGQTFGFSYFNVKFRDVFDLTQTRLSAIYLLATVTASLALPFVGGLTDRFGLRRSVLATVAALAGVCVLMSQAQGVAMLFAAFVLFRVLGAGMMVLLANNTLATWFDRRLGLASGLMQVAMAGAIAFVPAGMVFLIDAFGWRGAYLGIAAILAMGLLPLLAIVYRESPGGLGQFPDGVRTALSNKPLDAGVVGLTLSQARQHRAYWILLAATATWALIGTGYFFHLEAIFQAHGLGKSTSTRAMTYMAMGMGTFQILGGLLADRIALRWLVALAVGLLATSCVMMAIGNAAILIPGFAVFGIGQGLMSIVAATGWARYFGRAHLGKIRGMSLTAAIAGSSLGPLLMGVSDDYLGSFTPAFGLFAGLALVIAIAGVWATPPKGNDE